MIPLVAIVIVIVIVIVLLYVIATGRDFEERRP